MKMTISIQLTRGKTAVVFDQDADLASSKWQARKHGKRWYASRSLPRVDGKRVVQYLHQVIADRMGLDPTLEVDHEDHDGLNCQRDNLRSATRSQNCANQGLRADSTSGVKGVSWNKNEGKWHARVRVSGKSRHLGFYDDINIAKAIVETARELAFGAFACHGS